VPGAVTAFSPGQGRDEKDVARPVESATDSVTGPPPSKNSETTT
jgi:hypothetical protein